ncbi:hypothetical protein AVEN_36104-1 [Araneus ventricosus]|uniref:Uncharacterized protein n=1 Tax=Araneus ventricosus TaxID=182803 RepID=A0A4Y2IEJ3_ARAVE|nr:hypothetical protein AVEN_36104-1 [Araneus ventricosus]
MDLSVPFHLFPWVVGDVNRMPFISYLYPKGSLNDHSLNCLLPHSEQQPAEIRPTNIEVVLPVTAGLGVRGLMVIKELYPVPPCIRVLSEVTTTA